MNVSNEKRGLSPADPGTVASTLGPGGASCSGPSGTVGLSDAESDRILHGQVGPLQLAHRFIDHARIVLRQPVFEEAVRDPNSDRGTIVRDKGGRPEPGVVTMPVHLRLDTGQDFFPEVRHEAICRIFAPRKLHRTRPVLPADRANYRRFSTVFSTGVENFGKRPNTHVFARSRELFEGRRL